MSLAAGQSITGCECCSIGSCSVSVVNQLGQSIFTCFAGVPNAVIGMTQPLEFTRCAGWRWVRPAVRIPEGIFVARPAPIEDSGLSLANGKLR